MIKIAAEPLLQYSSCSLDQWMAATYWHVNMKALTRYRIILLGEQRSEAHWCEQLAQGRCLTMQRPGIEPTICPSRSSALTTTPASHQNTDIFYKVVWQISEVRWDFWYSVAHFRELISCHLECRPTICQRCSIHQYIQAPPEIILL